MPTPTCFGIKVPSSGSFSATNVRRSNKYFRQYSPTHIHHKSSKPYNIKIQITHPHLCNIIISHNH